MSLDVGGKAPSLCTFDSEPEDGGRLEDEADIQSQGVRFKRGRLRQPDHAGSHAAAAANSGQGCADPHKDIQFRGYSVGRLVNDLTNGRVKPEARAHLDPDLESTSLLRLPGWRGLFGQGNAAQRVLARKGVGAGDLFLFFGWFRQVEERHGVYCFIRTAPNLHVLWGWLQVDHMLRVGRPEIPAWARYHPHVTRDTDAPIENNILYVGRELLQIDGQTTVLPGTGVFGIYDDRLRLTKALARRSLWSLPAWFAPSRGRAPLGYHEDPSRWTLAGDEPVSPQSLRLRSIPDSSRSAVVRPVLPWCDRPGRP